MIGSRSAKPKVILSLALLKELCNRVGYYRTVVKKSIERYRSFVDRYRSIVPDRVKGIEREMKNLEVLDKHLERVQALLEGCIVRIETLLTVDDVRGALEIVRSLVKELRKSVVYHNPSMSIIVDRIDRISKELLSELRFETTPSSGIHATKGGREVLEEAKKVVDLKRG